jgi:RNA polymerase sigma-70 factor (ECF subfamily)
MAQLSDHDLLRRIASGEPEAAESFFRRHYERVRLLCARVVSSWDADDLAQETFLRVLRFAGNYRGEARAETWLYRIARNVCMDHVARERRAPPELPECSAPQDDPRMELLERAWRALTEAERATLTLSRFHDLSTRQLAEVLECSEAAARARVHRALEALRHAARKLEARDDIRSAT